MLNVAHIALSENNDFLMPLSSQEKNFISEQIVTFFRLNFQHRRPDGHYVQLQDRNSVNEKNLLNDLRSKIQFDEGIELFLVKRTDVLTLLSSVMAEIEKYFPKDFTAFFLRKSYDLNSKAFVLEIQSHQNYSKARRAFEDFDDDWWLDHMPQTNDTLIIGLSTL